MTLTELSRGGLGFVQTHTHFDARELDVLDNTPEEIEVGVDQMLAEMQKCDPGCHSIPRDAHIKAVFAKLGVVMNGRIADSFRAIHGDHFLA